MLSFFFLALVALLWFLFLTMVIRFLAFLCASFMASKRVSRSMASFMAVVMVFRFLSSSVLLAGRSLALALSRGGWVSFFPMSLTCLLSIRVLALLPLSRPLALKGVN